MHPLTNESADYLLSLKDSDLKAWLGRLPKPKAAAVVSQLASHRTPKERATESLYEFVKQAWWIVEPETDFADGWHIRAICQHLEAVTRGEIRDLLINVPPGCCKSLLCSVFWPAWVWTWNPAARWLFASYAQELSTRDSVKCRNIVGSPWYQENWNVVLVSDQNQKTRFDTAARGWRLATSVGGRGLGEHPDFIVVDDPHSTKEADSDLERQQAIEWWDGTISSRGRTRNSRRVVIMQRLHEADLSAHILAKGKTEHICLPMEFEVGRMKPTSLGWMDPREKEGDLLWPDLFTPTMVAELKGEMGEYRAAGQLQQRPAPRAGGMFHREWFKPVVEAPKCDQYVRYWDKAGTDGAGDWTVGLLMGRQGDRRFIIDVVRAQLSAGRRDDLIDLTAGLDDADYGAAVKQWFEEEPGSGGKQSAEISRRSLSNKNYRVESEKVTGSKVDRADALRSAAELGNVYIVKAKWNLAFLEELANFPNGRHDDQVDAASGSFNHLGNETAFGIYFSGRA